MKERNRPTNKYVAYVNRRSFLATSGLLALAAPTALADQKKLPGLMRGSQVTRRDGSDSQWWHARNGLVLLAEGVLPLDFVLPPPEVPDDIASLEARLRVTFPISATKNLLAFQIFLVPAGIAGVPWPVMPPLIPVRENDPVTISYGEVRIDDIRFGVTPRAGIEEKLPTFAILGEIVSNPVLSPFGDVTGAACIVTAGFDTLDAVNGETDFTMLGVTVSGNHTSIAPEGRGTLLMKR